MKPGPEPDTVHVQLFHLANVGRLLGNPMKGPRARPIPVLEADRGLDPEPVSHREPGVAADEAHRDLEGLGEGLMGVHRQNADVVREVLHAQLGDDLHATSRPGSPGQQTTHPLRLPPEPAGG